eukprot:8995561-Karenia_brevis.AAC.1
MSAFFQAMRITGGQVWVKWKGRKVQTGSSGIGHCQARIPRTAYNYPTYRTLFQDGKRDVHVGKVVLGEG